MRMLLIAAALALASCRDEAPAAPTAAEAEQLNEADAMLDDLAKEEGPEQRPGPSNKSD